VRERHLTTRTIEFIVTMGWGGGMLRSMESQIQYTRTDDGVSIACTSTGDGPPVLYCPSQTLSMQSMLSQPVATAAYDRELAGHTRFTTFDDAGIGASQRDVGDFSLEAQVRAIEAVAARLADERFTLVGSAAGSASAALYATRHSGRVVRLACVHPAVSLGSFAAAMREDWSLARRRFAGAVYPEGPVSAQRWFSTAMRESMTAEVAAAYAEAFAGADLREIYRRITVPTLLCVAAAQYGRDDALALASLVPDCRVAAAPSSKPAARRSTPRRSATGCSPPSRRRRRRSLQRCAAALPVTPRGCRSTSACTPAM